MRNQRQVTGVIFVMDNIDRIRELQIRVSDYNKRLEELRKLDPGQVPHGLGLLAADHLLASVRRWVDAQH